MKTICIIPARGGSKGIINKNLKKICGKPLIYYPIIAAIESKVCDKIIVSTDSIQIAKQAMQEPLRQIVTNAGDEGSVILAKVAEGKDSFGYNASTSEFGDMLKMGILDPTKVTRTALQNASSIAGLMITTECMVTEQASDEAAPAAPAMPDMGGMGGMGMGGMGM